MANQILEGVLTSDPQVIPEGYTMLNEGTPELSNPKFVSFAFGTTAVTSPQTYPNGDAKSPLDLTFGGTFPATIYRTNKVPRTRRLRVTNFNLSVNGVTAWASLTGLALQDLSTSPTVLAYFPVSSLQSMAYVTLPVPQVCATLQPTASSYAASTGVITFPASTFITTTLAGLPFRVVAGTGAGQVSGIIASNTATTLTPTTIPAIALDNTSVVEVPYWVASAGAGTTITASNGTFVSSALAAGGYWVVIVAGTGVGQRRLITANTGTQITVATWTTNPDATSVFLVTNNPANFGAFDMAIAPRQAYMNKGVGLAIGTYGTTPSAGSNIRIWGNGIVE